MIKQKNKVQYIIISVTTLLIIAMFIIVVIHYNKYDSNTYKVAEGSRTYDTENNLIDVKKNAVLKMEHDGNYRLSIIDDMLRVTYNLGSNAIINNETSSDLYLYGVFYQVLTNGTVNKINKQNVVSKIEGAQFFKISDRKYLVVDKAINSSDGSIKTRDYLIIELDKNGNSKLYNNYINVKTINPIIISTSTYDFDVANELLISNKTTIDLKRVIGSSNIYKKKTNEEDDNSTIDPETINSTTDLLMAQNEELRDQLEKEQDYYNSYFNTLKSTVNNLSESLNESNKKAADLQSELNDTKKSVKNNQTQKWLSLGIIQNGVSNITVNYNVFDPNNEYETVYLYVNDSKQFLDKSKTSILVRNLTPNTPYQIRLAYTLKNTPGEVIEDVIDVTTEKPKYILNITKKGLNKLYYTLDVDKNYVCSTGDLKLYSDGDLISTTEIVLNDYVGGKNAFLNVSDLGEVVELQLVNITCGDDIIDLNVYSKIVG